jgi:hypothetical protein
MSNAKGRLGENRARDWAIFNGWPAIRTATKLQDSEGQPDVVVDLYGQPVLIEAKNRKGQPPKTFLKFIDQAEGYCRQDEIPWLYQHVHGTSRDIISMEKDQLARTIRAAYAAGQRDAACGVPAVIPAAAVASVQADGAGDCV